MERLQKILARAGHGSRRGCETIIEQGRVEVDGQIAHLGDKADPATQRITVDGVPIRMPTAYTYIMLNKPRGYISTTDDPQGRRTVLDLVRTPHRLYPVGRLDADSEGLILLTDDGTLTQHLTHPRYEHPRVYRVLVQGEPTEEQIERWRKGITLDGRHTRVDKIEVESLDRAQSWLRVTMHEGRKHLVRRMVAALGHPAKRLIRVSMGPIELGNLPLGKWRHLHGHEVKALRQEVGTGTPPARGRRSRRGKRGRSSRRSSKSRRQRR